MKLELSDTLRTYDFLTGGDMRLKDDSLELPVVAREDTFAESADSEGRWRVRSRATNAEGRFVVIVRGTDSTTFWDNVDNLLELVESAHERKGTITYRPPNGTDVIWDLQAISVTGLPQRGVLLLSNRCEVEVSFECRPYGRLAEQTMLGYRDTMLGSPNAAICLPLGNNSGLTDLTGNGRHGTAAGGPTVGGSTSSPLTLFPENSTDLDGSDDRITTTYNPFTVGSSRTYMGWAFRDTSTTADTLFGGSVANPCVLQLAAGSQNVLFKPQNSTTTTWAAAWPSNTVWVHWALTFNDTTNAVALYINGALVSATTNADAYNGTPGNFMVGAYNSTTDPFDGKVAFVSVHERILSAQEIKQFYNAGSGSRSIAGPVDFFTVSQVDGQVRAWGNLELAEQSALDRQHIEIGLQENFDPANPEPLLLQAVVDLTALSGGSNTRAGSYSTNTLRSALTTVPAAVCSTGTQTHKGKWKVRVRVYATTANCRVRLAWRVGEKGSFTRERWVKIPGASDWYDLDLGTIDIAAAYSVWEGRIEMATLSGVPTVDVDTVTLIPATRYLRLRGATFVDPPVSSIIAAEDFDGQTAGALAGKTPALAPSGTWTGAGDSDDFTCDGAGLITRSAISDSASTNGRFARCGGGTLTNTRASVDFMYGVLQPVNMLRHGLLLRYTDTNNWLTVAYEYDSALKGVVVAVRKRVAGVETKIGASAPLGVWGGIWYRLSASVDTAGVVTVSQGPRNQQPEVVLTTAADSALATAGAIASGGYGIYDAFTSIGVVTRSYDNFMVTSPAIADNLTNAPLWATKRVRIKHNGAWTQPSSGNTEAPTPIREGSYLTLPPATRSNKKSRIVVRARRNNIDEGLPDTGLTDSLQAVMFVTPRVHLTEP